MSTDHPARRWGTGLSIAAAAGIAAMLGTATAHADDEVTPIDPGPQYAADWDQLASQMLTTDPAGLLNSAASNLTEASDVLSNADVPASLQQLLGAQTQIPDVYSQLVSQAQSIQDPLLSSDNSSVSGLANLFFGGIDQQFTQDSAAVLSAEQAFVADPSDTTAAGLLIADLQFAGAAIDSLFPELAGVFADRLLGLPVGVLDTAAAAGSDAAAGAGADLATSFDPADLFAF
jgi:hypothetical protein